MMDQLIGYLNLLSKHDMVLLRLLVLLIVLFIVLEALSKLAKIQQAKTRLVPEIPSVLMASATFKEAREYHSEKHGISGKPDAIILEDGFCIPIILKISANKLRDRFKAQALIYMRLIEEKEGRKPPYAYLFLGKKHRKVRVHNSEKNQNWLQEHLDIMHHAYDSKNNRIKAQPHHKKCQSCLVKEDCNDKILIKASGTNYKV